MLETPPNSLESIAIKPITSGKMRRGGDVTYSYKVLGTDSGTCTLYSTVGRDFDRVLEGDGVSTFSFSSLLLGEFDDTVAVLSLSCKLSGTLDSIFTGVVFAKESEPLTLIDSFVSSLV